MARRRRRHTQFDEIIDDHLGKNDENKSKKKVVVGARNYFRSIKNYPLLTREQEIQAGKDLKSGDPEKVHQATNLLMKSNLRLVISQAHRFEGHGVSFLDLIQEGSLGMERAISKFDVDKGFRFSTYATWWVRQFMRQAINYTTRDIYVPGHIRSQVGVMNQVYDQLEKILQHGPSNEEIAKGIIIFCTLRNEFHHQPDAQQLRKGLKENLCDHPKNEIVAKKFKKNFETTLRKVEQNKVYIKPMDSIDSQIKDSDSDTTLGDLIPDETNVDPELSIKNEQLRKDLMKVIDTLSKRDEITIEMSYGLNPLHKVYPPEVIAQRLGISRSRFRTIKTNAIKNLRHPARNFALKKYITDIEDPTDNSRF